MNFFWNFFEFFFEIFLKFFLKFFATSPPSHTCACLPHEWLFFLYVRREIRKHVFYKFRQIFHFDTIFDNFRHFSTFFDIFRQRFSTFRQYSTCFSSKIRQIFQAAIYKLSKNISENLAAIDRVSKTCCNLLTCKKIDKEQNLLKLTDINVLKYLILLLYPKLKLLQHFFCQEIKIFCQKINFFASN